MRAQSQVTKAVVDYLDPALREAVEMLSEPVRTMVAYYYGWVDAEGNPTEPVGVRRRPATVFLLLTGADETSWARVRGAAVGITLMQGSTIVHDDIQDNDELRNGRPSVWAAFGLSAAVQAGVAMLSLGLEILALEPPPIAAEAVRRTAKAARHICSGQVLDIRAERNPDLDLPSSLLIKESFAALPTAEITAIAAVCRGANTVEVDATERFGYHLGMALALYDDWEGAWGMSRAGLERDLSDIRRGRPCPYIAYALQSSGPARERISAHYKHATATDDRELSELLVLIEASGARGWLEAEIAKHVNEVHAASVNCGPRSCGQRRTKRLGGCSGSEIMAPGVQWIVASSVE